MITCRFCQNELKTIFADLNMAPTVNNYLKNEKRFAPEITYPLITYVCDNCKLVQTLDFNSSEEIFTEEYSYFSSFSSSWLEHSQKYVEMITKRLGLDKNSHVMEIASNDGYLLQYFQKKNIPHLGIEPCKSVADVAMAKNINTIIEFFSENLAKNLPKSDLICMCNVLAHVPNINDFTAGLVLSLKPSGSITVEFPHLLNIIEQNQFDTIYHEHYSYLSLLFTKKLFEQHGLKIYEVEELSTHGGSLRIFACHKSHTQAILPSVEQVLEKEKALGLDSLKVYEDFSAKVKESKRNLLSLLIKLKNEGKSIVAYGAAAKGNTLFNYCGISTDFIDYSVDLNPHKQNTYLPGSHIKVYSPDKISETKPDYILITPWNIKEEIIEQLSYAKDWNCKFIVAIPEAMIL